MVVTLALDVASSDVPVFSGAAVISTCSLVLTLIAKTFDSLSFYSLRNLFTSVNF